METNNDENKVSNFRNFLFLFILTSMFCMEYLKGPNQTKSFDDQDSLL